MAQEIWKTVPFNVGPYSVSDYGQIKNYKTNRILKPRKGDKYGHKKISLCKNGKYKHFFIHRLVLETFVGPCPPGMECRHLDGDPSNNRLDNLCYGTPKENQADRIIHNTDNKGSKHGRAKLNELQVRIIKRLLEDNYLTIKEIAKIFNISRQIISDIKFGRIWKNVECEK